MTAPALTQSVDVPWQANALIPEIQFRGDALAFSTEADGLCSSQLPQPQREGVDAVPQAQHRFSQESQSRSRLLFQLWLTGCST